MSALPDEFLTQEQERKRTRPVLPKERSDDHFRLMDSVCVVDYLPGVPKATGLVVGEDGGMLTVSVFSYTIIVPMRSWKVMFLWEYDFFQAYPDEFAAWCRDDPET